MNINFAFFIHGQTFEIFAEFRFFNDRFTPIKKTGSGPRHLTAVETPNNLKG